MMGIISFLFVVSAAFISAWKFYLWLSSIVFLVYAVTWLDGRIRFNTLNETNIRMGELMDSNLTTLSDSIEGLRQKMIEKDYVFLQKKYVS